MKAKLFNVAILLFLITSCSENNLNDSIPAQIETEEWHLIKSSGGLKGTSNQFDLESSIWIFNSNNATISITNNNKDAIDLLPLPSGTYMYSILEINGINYISIKGDEFGKISFPNIDTLIINQNKTSTGNKTDLYIYTFERKLVTEDVIIN